MNASKEQKILIMHEDKVCNDTWEPIEYTVLSVVPSDHNKDILPVVESLHQDHNVLTKFILLLLDSVNSIPIPGIMHLHNEIYLLQSIFPDLAGYTNDYKISEKGQQSETVRYELDKLESSGQIRYKKSGSLEITPTGSRVLEGLRNKTSKRELEKTGEFKKLLNDMTEDEVVAFACFSIAPPGQDTEVKYEDLAQKRKYLAISMYQRNKISAQRAAEISGENFEDFFAELKKVS